MPYPSRHEKLFGMTMKSSENVVFDLGLTMFKVVSLRGLTLALLHACKLCDVGLIKEGSIYLSIIGVWLSATVKLKHNALVSSLHLRIGVSTGDLRDPIQKSLSSQGQNPLGSHSLQVNCEFSCEGTWLRTGNGSAAHK